MKISNIVNLIKAYFYENWRKDVFVVFLIMAVLALFFGISSPGTIVPIYAAMFVFVMFYPKQLFSQLYNGSSRIHYLLVPASNAEKVTAAMLLANVYYVLAIVLSVLLGFGIALVVNKMLSVVQNVQGFETNAYLFDRLKFIGFANIVKMYVLPLYLTLSFFFFASIYFKKNPIGIGFLAIIGMFAIYVIVMLFTYHINELIAVPQTILNNPHMVKSEHSIINNLNSKNAFEWIIECVGIVFFYGMSFLRMKETEA